MPFVVINGQKWRQLFAHVLMMSKSSNCCYVFVYLLCVCVETVQTHKTG